MRATVGVLLVGGLVVALLLWVKGVYGPLDALRYGMFNTVSVATTTGFATTDYLTWPVFAPVLHVDFVWHGDQCRFHGRRHQNDAYADFGQARRGVN